MPGWTSDELTKIGAAEELQLASRRRDGTLRNPVTMWVVRHGERLYVRSVKGPSGPWFRGTQVRHEGHIRAGGVDKDVTFAEADHHILDEIDVREHLNDEIDAAYRSKYHRYAASIVGSVVTPQARSATIELVPRSAGRP